MFAQSARRVEGEVATLGFNLKRALRWVFKQEKEGPLGERKEGLWFLIPKKGRREEAEALPLGFLKQKKCYASQSACKNKVLGDTYYRP